MKGDFSRIIKGHYEGVLFEQGKPLTDAQLNWAHFREFDAKSKSLALVDEFNFKNQIAEGILKIPLETNLLTEKKLSQTVTANATSGEIRLGYQVELPDSGSVTLPVYCQPKFNAVRDSTENSSRLSGLGVVVAPHFFVSGTDVSNRDVTTGPPLGLKG